MTGKVKDAWMQDNEPTFDDSFRDIFDVELPKGKARDRKARQRAGEDWVSGRRKSPYPKGSAEDLSYTAEQQWRKFYGIFK